MTNSATTAPLYGPDADPDKANRPPLQTPFLLTLGERTSAEIKAHWPTAKMPARKLWPDLKWAWRNVHPDLTSTHGYRWPFPGTWAVSHIAPEDCVANGEACPTASTGGLCLARTIPGSLSGECKLGTSLICAYLVSDVLGSEPSKLRVRKVWVAEVIGTIAELTHTRSADLRSADLRYANLRYADLRSADLRYANLRYADLRYANLRYADLGYADLRYADLGYADLGSADLGSADLIGTRYSQLTLWPEGFDPKVAGAVLVAE